MIQTYLVDDHPEWAELVQVGPDAAGVDLLIGEPDLVGRGLGAQVLAEFARDVVFADPEVRAVVADRSRSRTAAPGARSRRPASATSATSRRTASRTA